MKADSILRDPRLHAPLGVPTTVPSSERHRRHAPPAPPSASTSACASGRPQLQQPSAPTHSPPLRRSRRHQMSPRALPSLLFVLLCLLTLPRSIHAAEVLTPGLPIANKPVASNAYTYYTIDCTGKTEELTVILTAITGDPDSELMLYCQDIRAYIHLG